jgi:hypothetical protein
VLIAPTCNTAKNRRFSLPSIGDDHTLARVAFQVEHMDDAVPDRPIVGCLADGHRLRQNSNGRNSTAWRRLDPPSFVVPHDSSQGERAGLGGKREMLATSTLFIEVSYISCSD